MEMAECRTRAALITTGDGMRTTSCEGRHQNVAQKFGNKGFGVKEVEPSPIKDEYSSQYYVVVASLFALQFEFLS